MRLVPVLHAGGVERPLGALTSPLDLEAIQPGNGDWEVEIGFGKGRYLLHQALAHPDRRFLGIEVVTKYYRLLTRRATRAGATNLATIRGEALYLLTATLPRRLAARVHVYFPDPWPKLRHHRRRLFDRGSVDLVLGLLRPGGELYFATDYLDYGERVATLLDGVPELEVERRDGPWPDGARTNYEAKYMREGRPILRLVVRIRSAAELHPRGRVGVVAAISVREDD